MRLGRTVFRARICLDKGGTACRALGKILREARDWEVWKFTTPDEVARSWPKLSKHLGRRRSFWEFLLGEWQQQGRLSKNIGLSRKQLREAEEIVENHADEFRAAWHRHFGS